MENFKPRIAICNELAGGPTAGLLLNSILYWWPKARVEHHDGLWIANPRTWWLEQTGLTLDRYRGAIKKLQEKGLVEVSYRRFRGVRITHLRPRENPPALERGKIPQPNSEGKSLSALTECTTEETTEVLGTAFLEKEKMERDSGKKKARKSTKQIAESLGTSTPQIARDETPQKIWEIWRDGVIALGLKPGPQWKGKALGQVNTILKKDVRFDELEEGVRAVLLDWADFTNYAEENSTAFTSPYEPDWDYCVRFIVPLLRYSDQKASKPSTKGPEKASLSLEDAIALKKKPHALGGSNG